MLISRKTRKTEQWLKAVGEKHWIVITRDERIRYREAEKQALRRGKVRAFVSRSPREPSRRDACAKFFESAAESSPACCEREAAVYREDFSNWRRDVATILMALVAKASYEQMQLLG